MREKDTKILCTIGPASSTKTVLRQMLKGGMNAARINTAHGDFKSYEQIIDDVRSVGEIPIVIDIKGPDLRIRSDQKYFFKKDDEFEVGFDRKHRIHFNFNILKRISVGDTVLISDGIFAFKVAKKINENVILKSLGDNFIEPDKNATFRKIKLNLPQLSKKDLESIRFANKVKAEYIALSFCRNKDDVLNLKKRLNKDIRIIAKIENHEGVKNIDEIIDATDGIIVARGDLGVELPPEKVPFIQKKIIRKCTKVGKVAIVATQMLDSMIQNPISTRAETSDVANAVLDGADCLMLSGETAIGKYPVEAVKYMSKVSINAEPYADVNVESSFSSISESISTSIKNLVKNLKIDKVVCLTFSGYTASMVARFRMNVPVVAVTNSEMVRRQLMLYYSIRPVFMKEVLTEFPIVKTAKFLSQKKKINKKDLLLFTAGLHTIRKTNTIQIHRVKDLLSQNIYKS